MELLRELDFTDSEINAYLALIDLGSTTTGPLVDKSGVSSSKIYEVLDRLIAKGFASYVYQKNIRHYQAAPPSRIADYVEERKRDLEEKKQRAQELLPQLQERYKQSSSEELARIHTGYKGVQNAFLTATEHMQEGDVLRVSGIPKRSKPMTRFFTKWYDRLEQQGVRTQNQFEIGAKTQIHQTLKNHTLGEVQFMPSDIQAPAAVNILNDRILIFPPEEEREPVLFELIDERVADSFRKQFDKQWNSPAQVFTGVEGPQQIFSEMTEYIGPTYAFGINLEMQERYVREERDRFIDHLEKTKQENRIIVNTVTDSRISTNAQVRILPEEFFSPLQVELYEDTVAIIDWSEPITTVVIRKKEFAEAYKQYFETLWKIAKNP